MAFTSQVEIDEALRVGTVDRAEIEAFHVAQAEEGLAQLALEAEVKALARFSGQKTEKDLTPEELAALEASYQDDVKDFWVKPEGDAGFVEEQDGLTEIEDAPPQGQADIQTNQEPTPRNESGNVGLLSRLASALGIK